MPGFSHEQWAVLSALVFLAGVVDSLAGGGGLITLPAYLAVGLPPALLLGTNKLASTIGTAVSTANYARSLRLSLRALVPAAAVSMAGSALGARLALRLDPAWIRPLLLAALPAAAYAVLSEHRFGVSNSPNDVGSIRPEQPNDVASGRPKPTNSGCLGRPNLRRSEGLDEDRSAAFSPAQRAARSTAVAFPIGVYDGFFGPGTGTFLALGFSRFCRFDLLRATAWAKFINLATNAAALAAFLLAGGVQMRVGLAMGAVSVAGHYAGSSLGLKQGAKAIRPVIALVCGGLFLKLLLDKL